MAARRPSPAQVRERRARIAAIVLGVVFLAVCAIQVPRVLHQLHKGDAVSAPPTVTTPATGLLIAVSAAAPHAAHLTQFASKDPFHQLVKTAASGSGSPATATSARTTPATAKTTTTTTTTASPTLTRSPGSTVAAATPPSSVVPFTPARTAATKPGALVLFRGARRALLRGDLFPAADPLFRVAGFTRTALRLQLLTGTLSGGTSVLTLRAGHRIVLRNTTDGTTTALEYLRVARVVPRTAPATPAG